MSIGGIAEPFARQSDHLIRYVDAVDFREVAAQGTHQAARTAANLESLPRAALWKRHAAQLRFDAVNDLGGGGEEIRVALLVAPEGYVIRGIIAGASVPVLAHVVPHVMAHGPGNFGIVHRICGRLFPARIAVQLAHQL